jgi:hypothetical protein
MDQVVEFEVPADVAPPMTKTNGTAVATRTEATPPMASGGTAQALSMIERLTFDTTIPIERVQQSYAFLREVQADQAKKEFVAAFADCQAEMEPVARDANNPQTKSKYASLAALDRAIRPIYTRHGFSLSFDAGDSPLPDHVRVLAFLAHKGGHERTYHIDMACDGKGAKGGDVMTKTHAMGSAFSYGKRYLEGNIFNVASAEKDDDGNAAGGATTNSALITAAQVAELEQLIRDANTTVEKFCAYGKVEKLADIQARHFAEAKRILLTKKASGGAK